MKASSPFGTRNERLASTPAIEAAAAEWVTRSVTGLDPAAKRERTAWLAANPQHQETFDRLSRTWAVFDRAEQRGAIPDILAHLNARARRRRLRRRMTTVAAAAALAVGLFTLRPRQSISAHASVSPAAGPVAFESIRKLPDGSIVELNDHAEIAVQFEPGVRRVQLVRGEALFRVEKDPTRPFLVQAGSVEVRAVGTAFNVRLDDQAVEVLVTHGTVSVEDAVNRVSLVPASATPSESPSTPPEGPDVLVAGQRMVVNLPAARPAADQRPDVHVAVLAPAEINQRLAWRIPQLEFGGMELAHATALLNRQNRLQISLGDEATGRLRISGVFRSDNPEGFVRIVEATFGLRAVRLNEHEIVLRKATN